MHLTDIVESERVYNLSLVCSYSPQCARSYSCDCVATNGLSALYVGQIYIYCIVDGLTAWLASLSHTDISVCRRRSAWYNTFANITAVSRMLPFVVFLMQTWIYRHRQTDQRLTIRQLRKPRLALSIPSSLNFANEVSPRSSSASYKSQSAQEILLQTKWWLKIKLSRKSKQHSAFDLWLLLKSPRSSVYCIFSKVASRISFRLLCMYY